MFRYWTKSRRPADNSRLVSLYDVLVLKNGSGVVMDVSIEGVVTSRLGLASHQNAVPLLRRLAIVNNGSDDLNDLVLELESGLPFAVSRTWPVDRLEASSTLEVPDRDVELREEYLADLSESARTSVHVTLRSSSSVLAEARFPVELLARNEWGGAGSMPELLAVFCTPNDPAVDKVLKAASDVLRRAGRPDGIDGYEAKSRQRVWELASALWSAVCGYKVSYALPPASFENRGQKIRTPSRILEGKVGTCMDTALLFAAALEQAGLNPVLLLTKGHAFCGVWLQPQEFAQVLVEDVSAVRKRIELDELLVFETTLATQSPAPSFSQAIDAGKRKLTDQDFVVAVDVHRARMQRLRPLSVSVAHEGTPRQDAGSAVSEALDAAPPLPAFDVETEEKPADPKGRVELWQRKLLDLTTRNRLLHLPERAKVVRLFCPDPAALEDMLAENQSVRIVPLPALEVGGRDSRIYEQRNRESLEEDLARQAMARSEVPSRMEKTQLDAALVDLFRKARSDLQEGGSNTLFLAIGFLRWKKSADDPRDYYAPLILLPVKLDRRSARSNVNMSRFDDEPRFNLTLLELLRHDFELNIHGLDGELPTDASGIDVNGIWKIVERAVRDVPGFEVVKDVVLGTFSFAKYLMWRDLVDRADQLEQNEVVRLLLHHKLGDPAHESTGDYPEPRELDEQITPAELFTPLPADSSQLAAVVASANGQSFVLDGPPGTGKSQTIANMIAHNLALGRRVLFVAEKMAALDVVKRRLEERGIGEFCLELHSNKSSKLHVLEQLDRAWTAAGAFAQGAWDTQAQKVRTLRDRLNQLVGVLHKRWPNGWSVYEAIGLVVHDGTPATPALSWPPETEHDKTQMDALRDTVRRLDLNRSAAESAGASMALIRRTRWSNAWQEAMVGAAREVLRTLAACDAACARTVNVTGLELDGSAAVANRLLPFVQLLPSACGVDLRFAFSPTIKKLRADAAQGLALLHDFQSAQKQLSCTYTPGCIRKLDVDRFNGDWDRASGKFWIFAKLAKKKVVKAVAIAAGTTALPDFEADLPILRTMKTVAGKLDALDDGLRAIPGWSGLDTDTVRMRAALRLAENLRTRLISLADSPEQLVRLRHQVQRLVVAGNDMLAADGAVAQATRQLAAACQALTEAAARFSKAADTTIDLDQDCAKLREAARSVVDNERSLNAWCSWCRVRSEAINHGLQPLVTAVEDGTLPADSVAEAFEVAYARWFATKAIDAEPLLCDFVPAEHESDIEAYAKAVDDLSELTSAYIRAKLSGQIPDKNDVSGHDGFAVLRHQLQLQRRHKPVRQLAQDMGEAFPVLAPCMLMSPLSIAQYLPADHALFDLVIFDEASQITPWDAVGSIARGKQVVMAGDPKQMPPTSFFNRGVGAAEEDTGDDLESILDECLAAGVPQHSLTWHYRSRHESLITFSNYTYYGGSLVTFPAADTRPSVVRWRRIDGIYARGKNHHNQAEAKAIVAEVVTRLTDRAFVASGHTIGIITLNVDQQQLVDDLLDQARKQHPSIEPFFDANQPEPVVVKNLETMQGDERDLIILGVGFGPTEPAATRMSMNFGPLNRDGGWRRLNVAVTRARREMMVFTSFDPAMIDLNRTSARAVQDLRHFIEFADRGPAAISAAVRGSVGTCESPFEEFVAEGLRAKGWETHPQIGVSHFRIDLGVVHPDRPGDYLVGVECDGATYHSAATARDRDKVREAILRGLGWRLIHVWSTEWWVDRDGALERLDRAIAEVLQQSRAPAAELQQVVDEQDAAGFEPDVPATTGDPDGPEGDDGGDGDAETNRSEPLGATDGSADTERLVARGPDSAAPRIRIRNAYHKADLSTFQSIISPEDFYDPGYDATLGTLVQSVLEQEAPILDRALVDRIARVHGFQRSGRLIRERVLGIARRSYCFTPDPQVEHGQFVWMTPDDPERWASYRVPEVDGDVRQIDAIPQQEIVAAARSVHAEDPPLEIARMFGVHRLSNAARSRIVALLS